MVNDPHRRYSDVMFDEASLSPTEENSATGFAAYTMLELQSETQSLFLLCDHASNALPPEYGSLGLPQIEFERHIAYDIGAAGLTRRLAERLSAPAILSGASRLLIDPNRGLDDPTLIMRLSDGRVIPANRIVEDAERVRRIERFYVPYHSAILERLDAAMHAGTTPILLSIHSFTPVWKGAVRPWHAGVFGTATRASPSHCSRPSTPKTT